MGDDSDRAQHQAMKIEEFEAQKVIDSTALISDLSHQLELAHGVIEELETAKRDLRSKLLRAEGAQDSLRELLKDLYGTR